MRNNSKVPDSQPLLVSSRNAPERCVTRLKTAARETMLLHVYFLNKPSIIQHLTYLLCSKRLMSLISFFGTKVDT